jgi:hypothetical protein
MLICLYADVPIIISIRKCYCSAGVCYGSGGSDNGFWPPIGLTLGPRVWVWCGDWVFGCFCGSVMGVVVMSESVGPIRCLSCLRWAYLHFSSQWNLCGASIPFSKAFRNCDFSPLRRRCCVASFGFGCSQRLLVVSAACLISPRSNCVVGFALWFRVEFSCRRRMEVFLSRRGLISQCEWILPSFEAAV